MPEIPEDAALIKEVQEICFKPSMAYDHEKAARAIALVRAHDASAQAAEITALRARVAGLEGALRPFAELADVYDGDPAQYHSAEVEVADLHVARAALTPSAAQEADHG